VSECLIFCSNEEIPLCLVSIALALLEHCSSSFYKNRPTVKPQGWVAKNSILYLNLAYTEQHYQVQRYKYWVRGLYAVTNWLKGYQSRPILVLERVEEI